MKRLKMWFDIEKIDVFLRKGFRTFSGMCINNINFKALETAAYLSIKPKPLLMRAAKKSDSHNSFQGALTILVRPA